MNKPAQARKGAAKNPAPGKAATARPASRKGGRPLFIQHQAAAVDSLSRLLREPGASFLTWAVIGIALALPLCLLLFLQNLQQLNASLEEAGNISLFMAMDAGDAQLEESRQDILAMPEVAAVEVISAAQALAEFQTSSGFGNALEGLEENPLPPVLVVTPEYAGPEALPALAARLETLPGVEYAQVDLEWLQRLYAIIGLAERVTTGLALLLCLGVVLVVGNTVRLAIENRRDEIVVVKLVGGTDAFVSRPFLYTGFWYGVGGGLVAVLLAMAAFLLLAGPLTRVLALYDSDFSLTGLTASDLLALLAVAGGLGLAGAWVSVLRHLRRIEPR